MIVGGWKLMFLAWSLLLLGGVARGDWCVPGCRCTEEEENGARYADCSHRHLLNVDSEMLGGELHVQALDLSHNSLTELTANFPGNVKGRWRLLALSLVGNAISSVSSEALIGLTSLRALDLSDNRIAELPPRLFLNIPSLKAISLEGNRLRPEQGGDGWLLDAPHVTRLSLARCVLGHLDTMALSRLPSLVTLDLSGNQLTELPAMLPPLLRRLELFGNPLRCDEPNIKTFLAKYEQADPVCGVQGEGPKKSEAMRAYESPQQPAVFSGLLCDTVNQDETSSESSSEFGDDENVPRKSKQLESYYPCPSYTYPFNWLHLWGLPAMWAALFGLIAGIMVSAWAIWCWHSFCKCCSRRSTLRRDHSSGTTLLLGDSSSSLLVEEVNNIPPGTPPPPYLGRSFIQ